MSLPVPIVVSAHVPALVAAAGERAGMRLLEFFAANIRNPHTRRAYARAADEFLAWCAAAGVAVDRSCAAGARRYLDRGRDARARCAERQATACRDPALAMITGAASPPSACMARSKRCDMTGSTSHTLSAVGLTPPWPRASHVKDVKTFAAPTRDQEPGWPEDCAARGPLAGRGHLLPAAGATWSEGLGPLADRPRHGRHLRSRRVATSSQISGEFKGCPSLHPS